MVEKGANWTLSNNSSSPEKQSNGVKAFSEIMKGMPKRFESLRSKLNEGALATQSGIAIKGKGEKRIIAVRLWPDDPELGALQDRIAEIDENLPTDLEAEKSRLTNIAGGLKVKRIIHREGRDKIGFAIHMTGDAEKKQLLRKAHHEASALSWLSDELIENGKMEVNIEEPQTTK